MIRVVLALLPLVLIVPDASAGTELDTLRCRSVNVIIDDACTDRGCSGVTIIVGTSGSCQGEQGGLGEDGEDGCAGIVVLVHGFHNCRGGDGGPGGNGGDGCAGLVINTGINCFGGDGGSSPGVVDERTPDAPSTLPG